VLDNDLICSNRPLREIIGLPGDIPELPVPNGKITMNPMGDLEFQPDPNKPKTETLVKFEYQIKDKGKTARAAVMLIFEE
jgi:hypothetical protein